MSYILDALNKSEKERTKKRTPGLSALQEGDPPPAFGIKGFLVVLLILAVANSLGVYFYFGERLTESADTSHTRPEDQPANQSLGPETQAAPTAQLQSSPGVVTDYSGPETDIKTTAAAKPIIEVTAHIYASDSELRMVKIDGISRHEGDTIGPDHQLIEITEMGLVLEYEGERYELNVVEDWQSE